MMNTSNQQSVTSWRIRRELKTVKVMIEIYCRDHRGTKHDLCLKCRVWLKKLERRAILESSKLELSKLTDFQSIIHS